MKKNALPCIVLAALMASSSLQGVYAEELSPNEIISSSDSTASEETTTSEDEDLSQAEDSNEDSSSESETDSAFTEEEKGENTDSSEESKEENSGFEEEEINEDNKENETLPEEEPEEEPKEELEEELKTEEMEMEKEEEKEPIYLSSVESTSSITVRIRMDYPLTKETVEKQNIKMTVSSANGKTLASPNISYKYVDRYGNECSQNDIVSAIDIVADSLPAGSADNIYTVTVTGDGYRTYTYRQLSLEKYSKIVTIGTKESTFTLGDVNNDGTVNSHDQEEMQSALGTTDADYDINKDGKVNIIDLYYVNRGIMVQGTGMAVAQNGSMVAQAVINNIDTDETDLSNVEISGGKSLSDLFTAEEEVTLTKTDSEEISESSPLEIPIAFTEPVEMSEIQISTPSNAGIEKFNLIVETEDGTETIPYENAVSMAKLSSRSTDNVLVVNLGSRKVVKKVTIQVTKTADNETALIKQIEFVEEILEKAPEAETQHQ